MCANTKIEIDKRKNTGMNCVVEKYLLTLRADTIRARLTQVSSPQCCVANNGCSNMVSTYAPSYLDARTCDAPIASNKATSKVRFQMAWLVHICQPFNSMQFDLEISGHMSAYLD